MRIVSPTLEAAQAAAKRTPYIKMVFNGGTTYDFSTDSAAYGNRILLIDHREDAYDFAPSFVTLRNYDKAIPKMKGYWVEIGYGDVTEASNEYSTTSRLWVKHQEFVSYGGVLLCILQLEGMWTRLTEALLRIGSPPYYIKEYAADEATIYEILEYIIETEMSWVLEALVEDDGIINSYKPNFFINESQPFEDAAFTMRRLIRMTNSYLRAKASVTFEVIYPQDADAVDITYYSAQSPYFIEYVERENVLIPNHIYVFANAGEDGLWADLITGEASDQPEIDAYQDVIDIELAPEITTQTDADNRAAAVLTRARAENWAGRLVIPHDCQLELYDNVEIRDTRGL